jgi:hypothetical protein
MRHYGVSWRTVWRGAVASSSDMYRESFAFVGLVRLDRDVTTVLKMIVGESARGEHRSSARAKHTYGVRS